MNNTNNIENMEDNTNKETVIEMLEEQESVVSDIIYLSKIFLWDIEKCGFNKYNKKFMEDCIEALKTHVSDMKIIKKVTVINNISLEEHQKKVC